ncbi:molecular chaperone DnaJ [Corallococcus exercitus]|uniref:helix-turn-helix domain-containing protein n=1 Tax=Corallococcus exercitus TaxID=2316736 RepID=UPI000EA2AEE5|nr:helix-turn-helix domain-containing protein [Corallococcus exercitus]RKG76913.1 molecular chaperone DnaJ [Corallococcus exercitus]
MKPFAQQTYYELLEVPPTASDAEIRAAHERLMELYSPDSIAVYALGDPDQVDALRERMNEAMEMLTDADLRVEYDRSIGLSTERLAKAAATADAADKVDSAARVAEALATAAAALAKAAGAVDAERLEAESRLKAAASVSDTEGEAPSASEPPGMSEERMRGEESKRQEASGKDAPGVPPEPVMVGGVTVVEAFRASFTRSLSFVYVPTSPLRGQGRGAAEAPAPALDAKPSASEGATPAVAPKAVEAEASSTSAPEAPPAAAHAAGATASDPGGTPAATPAQDVAAQAPAHATPERTEAASPAPSAPAESEPGSTMAADGSAVASGGSAVVADGSATASEPVEAAPAPSVPSPAASEDAQAPAVEVSPEAPVSAATSPAEPGSVTTSPAPDASSAAAVTTTQGESDPNPAPGAPTPGASTTALARTPASGAARGAVRPLTSRPIDSRSAANNPTGPGTVKGPTVRKLGEAQVLAQDSAIATAESALAQVAAKVREARPRGVDIPADAEFNGELLRRVREARGLSIQQLADRTRISVRHLENVEADRYTALPTTVYLRGILMNLARELGLDPLRVSKSYLALFSEKPAKSGR